MPPRLIHILIMLLLQTIWNRVAMAKHPQFATFHAHCFYGLLYFPAQTAFTFALTLWLSAFAR
jgi:hypothetical protein